MNSPSQSNLRAVRATASYLTNPSFGAINNARNEVLNEQACINPVCGDPACGCNYRRSAADRKNLPHRVPGSKQCFRYGGPLEAFRQELSKLGWIEGKNIAFEYRFAEQKPERVPELAAELVRLKVDLIVTSGNPPALEAKKATTTIPIVMTSISDPVALGLVDSLARPGGNVTGFSTLATELNTKRLEILKDAVPKLDRVGLLRAAGGQPGRRTTTQGAQGCGFGAEGKIGGDQDSIRRPRFRERLSKPPSRNRSKRS